MHLWESNGSDVADKHGWFIINCSDKFLFSLNSCKDVFQVIIIRWRRVWLLSTSCSSTSWTRQQRFSSSSSSFVFIGGWQTNFKGAYRHIYISSIPLCFHLFSIYVFLQCFNVCVCVCVCVCISGYFKCFSIFFLFVARKCGVFVPRGSLQIPLLLELHTLETVT